MLSTERANQTASSPAHERVRAIDWLRGLAVLFMVQCHALSLLRPELRQSALTKRLLQVDGLVAPSFLFAAGFALALLQVRSASTGSRHERLGRSLRRAGEVLVVALCVNFAWFHHKLATEPWWLVRMDILLCIGVALLLVLPAAAGLAAQPRVLRGVALVLALVTFGLSPLGEAATGPWAWVLNKSTGATFPLLPWLGFAWLGAYAGAAAGEHGRAGLQRALLGIIALATLGWLAAQPLHQLYPPHHFHVTNPSNAAERSLWVSAALLALVTLEQHLSPSAPPSLLRRFLERFGTSSLSAYVLHEALLYYPLFGFSFNTVWGKRCGWGQYTLLTGALIALTYVLCMGWEVLTRQARRALATLAERLRWQGSGSLARGR